MDIGNSFQNATDGFFAFLPNLLGFLVILLDRLHRRQGRLGQS